ncbi:MAG: Gfo/Idh/MocA family oxidoreductase [Alteromonadaceae bacterium]|nr:Gfo/Idh/MocA family oxidoreductase [Alteromonadaceae bacterium]
MTTIKWGILSAGKIAHQFCQDMAFVNNGELQAVAARQLENAKSFAEQYKIPSYYQGYQALFDDPNVDAIYIATPHTFHFENTRDALLAGKHVLCEKPVTVTPIQLQELIELAKERQLFFMEAMWTYFLPAVQTAKLWVEQGRIGALKHIKADFGYPVPYDPEGRMHNPDLAGGCLFDMGIYSLAIANFFTTGQLQSPSVHCSFALSGVDNDVLITARCDDIILSLGTSFQCKLKNSALIIGDKGYIELPNFWKANECQLYELDNCIDHFQDHRRSLGYNYETAAVGEMIAQGKLQHPTMPHEQSMLLQKQIEQIRASF